MRGMLPTLNSSPELPPTLENPPESFTSRPGAFFEKRP
jgi:hypothetical protein